MEVIYVGKARDLRRRVASYFGRKTLDAKTQAMLANVARMEVTVTATEQAALLLEYNLIKEHRPKFNVVLRDDKSYPYIHVTTEQEFPRFEFHRGSRGAPGRFLGPFPNAGAVRQTLQQLQKLFRVRQCSDTFFANRSRPCLQYQIRRCSGPCVGLVEAGDYRRDVEQAIRFIEGRNDAVLAELVEQMEQASAALQFERAAQLRDRVADVRRVQEQQVIAAGADADIDAIALATDRGQCCVAILMIRGGRVLGSRALFPRAAPATPPAEIIRALVSQHYLEHPAPAEILVGCKIDDAGLLEAAISARAGRSVKIVGSTAIPGAITKGDLDLVVRVARNDFALADNVLARHYMRNTASHRSRSFSSFNDDEADPPLGIQLTVRGGGQDHFLKFRDALVADPTLIARYNTLKHRCAGLTMAAYRRWKSAFIKRVLAQLGR